MALSLLDTTIVLAYIFLSIFLGFWISKKAKGDMRSYFLGDNSMKWYWLGFSNSSGMFDINGAAWRVAVLVIYGFQSVWIPWIWPVWNQVIVMIFMAIWIRRSGVMTGAEWIQFRFGDGRGARLSHLIVVVFAVLTVVASIAYFFVGIGPFAASILPWNMAFSIGSYHMSSEHSYSLLICFLTTLYTIKGGIYSVVATEVMQFAIMVVSCILIVVFAFTHVDIDYINGLLPDHWLNFWPEKTLSIAWQDKLPFADIKIDQDGFRLFQAVLFMMIGKGIFASLAGPVPGFDMQRMLSAESPRDAARMSGFTILVLFIPLYLMVGGLALIAFQYVLPLMQQQTTLDFERILSIVVSQYLPVGMKGLIIAGLLAAFMSTFSAFVNVAPAYLVNDLYKRYWRPYQTERHYIRWSYLLSIVVVAIGLFVGFFIESLNSIVLWITSALYGGYCAANVLKWFWWRFNGYGYFYGMMSGIVLALVTPPCLEWFVTAYFPAYGGWVNSSVQPLFAFFIILALSTAVSIIACKLTSPVDESALLAFYVKTKPWGFWGKMKARLLEVMPAQDFQTHPYRDMINVLIGITWQMAMVALPLFVIFRQWPQAVTCLCVWVVTSVALKLNWYDKLPLADE